jgi:hypothetical protein
LRLVKSYYGEDKWRTTAAAAAVKGWRFSLMMVWQGGCQRWWIPGQDCLYGHTAWCFRHQPSSQPSELRTRAHEHTNNAHPCPRIGRGTWQRRRVIHTLTDTANPELDSRRAKAVHGRRSLPAGPCRIVLVYHYLPCRCPPSSVVSGSYWELVLRIITCP